jgi:hypothetical protein
MIAVNAQTLEFGLVLEQETLQEKPGLNPGAIKFGHEQAELETRYRNPQLAIFRSLGERIFRLDPNGCFRDHAGVFLDSDLTAAGSIPASPKFLSCQGYPVNSLVLVLARRAVRGFCSDPTCGRQCIGERQISSQPRLIL